MTNGDLTTIELFSGIGGFRLAADAVGLRTIWANDLNPLSCAVYRQRFGSVGFVEGDIRPLISQIPEHDVLTAGFPCQPFSAAGKKQGTRDPRGTLFEVIVEVVRARRPRFFVLENVKRLLSMEHGEHFATVLSALSELDYFIEWRVLNAKNFGLAQNRERVVIVGSRLSDGLCRDEDISGMIRLATAEEITYQKEEPLRGIKKIANWHLLSGHGAKFPNWGMAYKGAFFSRDLGYFSNAKKQVLLRDVLEFSPAPEYDLTEATLHRLGKNELVGKYVNGVEIVSNQGGGARMGYTIFGVGGIAPTLTASTSRHYERYFVDGRYRRLTPTEYARLQGFPDDHCDVVRPYDQYALLGNAVPPPLVEWVLNRLIVDGFQTNKKFDEQQPDLFYA